MSISFKRNDVQVYVENAQNCYDLEIWSSYQHIFKAWKIQSSDILPLSNCIESDITSYFFKAFESFIQAVVGLHEGKFSWSTVKLYYSIFYLLRCDILLSNHLIVRCKGLYYSKLTAGSQFVQYTKGKVRGDHQLTIALVKELHKNGLINDPILDNLIEENDAYTWYMLNRERINYQQKNFVEPEVDENFAHISSYFNNNSFLDLVDFYNSKDYTICFDLEHSILSIPYKKITQILYKANGKINFRGKYLRKLSSSLKDLKKYDIEPSELIVMINNYEPQHFV